MKSNLDSLQHAIQNDCGNISNDTVELIEFCQKVEGFSEMSLNSSQSQTAKDRDTGLIKNVRSLFEHIIIKVKNFAPKHFAYVRYLL